MTNRINMSYGEEVNLIVMRKKTRAYNVFNEWLSARELFYLGQLHISEQRYSYGDKLWKNQQNSAFKNVQITWCYIWSNFGMRRIVWWTFERNICPVSALPLHYLVTIEKELIRSAKKPIFHEKSSTISWNFWINQHQVIFLTYRMYNPTVQSVRSLLKNIWSGQWMNFWILPITHQLEKGQS